MKLNRPLRDAGESISILGVSEVTGVLEIRGGAEPDDISGRVGFLSFKRGLVSRACVLVEVAGVLGTAEVPKADEIGAVNVLLTFENNDVTIAYED